MDRRAWPADSLVVLLARARQAWEYMGHIWEKDQAYVNAVEFYEYAWTYSNQKNMGIGYKLAFNYLKAQKCVSARQWPMQSSAPVCGGRRGRLCEPPPSWPACAPRLAAQPSRPVAPASLRRRP